MAGSEGDWKLLKVREIGIDLWLISGGWGSLSAGEAGAIGLL